MTGSFTDKLLAKAKKVLEIGSEAADVLVHLQHGASPVGLAAVGMRVINSVREHRAKTPEEHFASWKPIDLGMLATQALTALRTEEGVVCSEVPGMHDETPAVITRIDRSGAVKPGVRDHVELGWAIEGSLKRTSVCVREVWTQPDADQTALFQRIGQSLWTHVGASQICLSVGEGSAIPSAVRLIADDDSEILPSAKGDALYERVQKFQAKGLRRSFFLIGGPGVGKSCMLRYVASLHGGFRLRLRMSKLVDFNPHALVRIVEILRPSVLIVDDFDRYVMGSGEYDEEQESAEGQAMLDPLEVFDKLVPLVLVSANYSKAITEALLRPGRFAEMNTIDEIDPEIYAQKLPGASAKMLKKLKRLKVPVAYLEEIRLRAEALGYEVAEKEIPELIERSEEILRRNRRATAERRHRAYSTLTGKTPAQKAVILDRQSVRFDTQAASAASRAATLRKQAETRRKQAAEERDKAERKKAKKAAKTAAKKTKTRRTRKP